MINRGVGTGLIWSWQLMVLPVIGWLISTPAGLAQSWETDVARFDPSQPVHLRVINRTPYPIEYGLTDPRPQVKEVQAGDQIELKQIRIPNCLGLNTPMLAPVVYQVSALADNWIRVEVRVSPEIYGVHCLDLRQDGEIYVY